MAVEGGPPSKKWRTDLPSEVPISVLNNGLCDLSAAWDTADHSVIIHQLKYGAGISGVTLQWLQSFQQTEWVGISLIECIRVTFCHPCSWIFTWNYCIRFSEVWGWMSSICRWNPGFNIIINAFRYVHLSSEPMLWGHVPVIKVEQAEAESRQDRITLVGKADAF